MNTATLSTPRRPQFQLAELEKFWFAVIALALIFLTVTVRAAWLHPFRFHELSTLFVTATPTLQTMFRAAPADGNPPLYFLLARLCLHFPIKTELALRLPALVAYFLAALTVYRFVMRDAGRTFAWLAMSVFLGCSTHVFATDARPYSLLQFFTGLALCCWQSYCRSGNRIALAGIALSATGAICSHQYGVIYVTAPLFVGEIVRSLRRKHFDPAVLIAGAVGGTALLLTFPPMLRGQNMLLAAIRASVVFSAHPRISDLKDYAEILPKFIPVLAFMVFLALLLKIALTPMNQPTTSPSEVPIEDIGAAVMLALLLPLILIVTHLGTNYFQLRYGIGSAMGISMLCGLLLPRLRWRHVTSLAAMAAIYCLIVGLLGLWFAAAERREFWWNDPILHSGSAQEPIIIASAVLFSPIWWYSDHEMRARLHYLADPAYAARQSDFVAEYSLALEHAYTPMQLDDYRTFLASHLHFMLFCSGEASVEWVKQRLIKDGWHLKLLQSGPVFRLPTDAAQRYREMYEVSR